MTEIARILCPVDFSQCSRRALDYAAAVASWYEAQITVLYVFRNMPVMDIPPEVLEAKDRERLLADLRRFTAHLPPGVVRAHMIQEAPEITEEILAQASAGHADLIVMGSHGRSGFNRLVLGSVAERVIRRSACPTMIVPPGAPDAVAGAPVQFSRILCPVDFSEGAIRALEYAMTLAEESDAQLTLLHVVQIPPELSDFPLSASVDLEGLRKAAKADALRRLHTLIPEEARTYCTVETELREGAPYREILACAAAREAGLIVMGVQGRGAIDLMVFGSNTARVTRHATCPVLVVGEGSRREE